MCSKCVATHSLFLSPYLFVAPCVRASLFLSTMAIYTFECLPTVGDESIKRKNEKPNQAKPNRIQHIQTLKYLNRYTALLFAKVNDVHR